MSYVFFMIAAGLGAGRCFRLLRLIEENPWKADRYALEAVVIAVVCILGFTFLYSQN